MVLIAREWLNNRGIMPSDMSKQKTPSVSEYYARMTTAVCKFEGDSNTLNPRSGGRAERKSSHAKDST